MNYTHFRTFLRNLNLGHSAKRWIAFSVAALLTLSIAGCGGDDKKETKPAETPKPNPKALPPE